jgi:hypothetical protein
MAIVGVATYLILTIPTVISLGSKYEMHCYQFDPVNSRIVQVTSKMFGVCTIAVSVADTMIMICLFILNPWGATTRWIALAWLVYVWGLASYIFIVPHYFLYKAIVVIKYRVFRQLDLIVNDYQAKIKDLNKNEWASFKEIISLREKVSASKNSPIELGGWTQYVTSLFLPTLSYVSGVLDLASVIKKILM